MALVAVLWSVGILSIDCVIGTEIVDQTTTSDFLFTSGTVIGSRVEIRDHASHSDVFLGYDYQVDGLQHGCHNNTYLNFPPYSGSRTSAEAFVARHPEGSPITVYYRANNPADAVLEVGYRPDVVDLAPMTVFNGYLVLLWVYWWRGREVEPD